ncbi:unnamed protein product [Schistocephalus solidus]|uniref:PI3K/PI4K domain-containing protein n=1 Tax=Schistocephalus solidus TaxID=70667 RepID=A0A183TD08_SCHSO|nr:unnamed protein product [Schistocephalus solidus]
MGVMWAIFHSVGRAPASIELSNILESGEASWSKHDRTPKQEHNDQFVQAAPSPTLDNLDTFLRFCNPDDGLQVQLMIKAGSDGFASLVVDYAVSKVGSRL